MFHEFFLHGAIVSNSKNASVGAFRKFIKENSNIGEETTAYLPIGSDDVTDYYLVMGYMDGFEDDELHLCAKIGMMPPNSLMSEYDIDFVMPYDPETGDVWATEISDVDPSDADWLYDEFMDMVRYSEQEVDETSYDDEEEY